MPTVHRLTALLTERGWLDRDPATRRLRLGLQMARLMPAMLAGMRLPELARPHLPALPQLQETVNIAILQGAEIIYLLSEPGDRMLTSQGRSGCGCPHTARRSASACCAGCLTRRSARCSAPSPTSGGRLTR